MTRRGRGVGGLVEAYRAAGMDAAMALEERFTDAELGLAVQDDNRHGYPTLD